MEKDLITQALQTIFIQNGKDLHEVQQYLNLKYRMNVDELVLQQRAEKLLADKKAVA